MLTQLTHLLSIINNFIWGLPAVILLVGTGAFLTFYLGFIQIRAFPHAFAVICGKYTKKKTPGEISHFRALMTGLSGTIGTGNIAGVATAIAMGGPGAADSSNFEPLESLLFLLLLLYRCTRKG